MINNSPFDNHIKGEFEHYSPDVPDHIWQNIMAKRDKRKPAGFWFNFFTNRLNLSIIGVLIITGGILLFQNISNTTVGNELNKHDETANTSKILIAKVNSNNITDQPNVSTNNIISTNTTADPSNPPVNNNTSAINKNSS